MANDDSPDASDTRVDAHSIAEEVTREVSRGAGGERGVQTRDAVAVGVAEIVETIRRDLMLREARPLVPLTKEQRIERLENRSQEMEWVLYGLLGFLFVLWLVRR
jgi:hypothetical protein